VEVGLWRAGTLTDSQRESKACVTDVEPMWNGYATDMQRNCNGPTPDLHAVPWLPPGQPRLPTSSVAARTGQDRSGRRERPAACGPRGPRATCRCSFSAARGHSCPQLFPNANKAPIRCPFPRDTLLRTGMSTLQGWSPETPAPSRQQPNGLRSWPYPAIVILAQQRVSVRPNELLCRRSY
jgi:hypothetical protein